jgi:hypothetical protein
MKTSRRIARALLCVAVTVGSTLPASAQTATTQPLPRNNVTGAAIATRRPGVWVAEGDAQTAVRITTAITDFGGITYSAQDPNDSIIDIAMPGLLQILLNAINSIAAAIKAAIPVVTTGT